MQNLHRGSLYKHLRMVSPTVSGAMTIVLLRRSMRLLCMSASYSTIARGVHELARVSRWEHSISHSPKLRARRKRVPQRISRGIVINPHHTRFTHTTNCVMPNVIQLLHELTTRGRLRLTSHIRGPRCRLRSLRNTTYSMKHSGCSSNPTSIRC